VNVIVVDFRGYDTMGEITVFAVAALAIFGMVRMGRRRDPLDLAPGGTVAHAVTVYPSPILRSIARVSLHLMLLFSVYLLFRGHNSPGGGFIAGVLTAVAVIVQMVAFDMDSFRKEIPWNPFLLVAIGLTLSASTGLGALVFGRPFLTSTFFHAVLPLLGYVELATAALFDVGVYLVVVGTALAVIRTIAEGQR
jgi:multicomponent K+:H+ antiporter subunit A